MHPNQLLMCFEKRGGKRKGAGRKSTSEKPCRRHVKRAKMKHWNPLHVTLRLVDDLPSLRQRDAFDVVYAALAAARARNGLRIVHYTVLANHIHLIVEAQSREVVTRGLIGFQVRLVKALNKLWNRRGSIFADRYHDEVITNPRQTRNTLRYVIHNAHHHKLGLATALDPCSSALAFDGWKESPNRAQSIPTVVPAQTWLLTTGWKRHGLIGLREFPRAD